MSAAEVSASNSPDKSAEAPDPHLRPVLQLAHVVGQLSRLLLRCAAGAGKSTLLSVLFSLGPLSGGSVSVAGVDLVDISCHEVRYGLRC